MDEKEIHEVIARRLREAAPIALRTLEAAAARGVPISPRTVEYARRAGLDVTALEAALEAQKKTP